jgi:hypothetical protein
MEIKLEDLLAFSSYYALTKNAAKLPISNRAPKTCTPSSNHTKNDKPGRKKLEMGEPKRP